MHGQICPILGQTSLLRSPQKKSESVIDRKSVISFKNIVNNGFQTSYFQLLVL